MLDLFFMCPIHSCALCVRQVQDIGVGGGAISLPFLNINSSYIGQGWKDSSAVKSTCYSSRREFSSQDAYQVAHD